MNKKSKLKEDNYIDFSLKEEECITQIKDINCIAIKENNQNIYIPDSQLKLKRKASKLLYRSHSNSLSQDRSVNLYFALTPKSTKMKNKPQDPIINYIRSDSVSK